MPELTSATRSPVRPLALVAVAFTGVFASGLLGAVTNAVNGWVSPLYFVTVMRWREVDDVWRASVAQGIFEGLLFGVLFSLVFTVSVGCITRVSCSYAFATRHLLGIRGGGLLGPRGAGRSGAGAAQSRVLPRRVPWRTD